MAKQLLGGRLLISRHNDRTIPRVAVSYWLSPRRRMYSLHLPGLYLAAFLKGRPVRERSSVRTFVKGSEE